MTHARLAPNVPKEGPRRLPAGRRPQVPRAYRVEVEGAVVGEVYQRTRETCRHLPSGVRYCIRHSLKWYYRARDAYSDADGSHDTRREALHALLEETRRRREIAHAP